MQRIGLSLLSRKRADPFYFQLALIHGHACKATNFLFYKWRFHTDSRVLDYECRLILLTRMLRLIDNQNNDGLSLFVKQPFCWLTEWPPMSEFLPRGWILFFSRPTEDGFCKIFNICCTAGKDILIRSVAQSGKF